MSQDRRVHERYPFRSVIEVQSRDSRPFQSQAVNLSVGGLCFVSPVALREADGIKIRFQLGETSLACEATVRHATRVITEIDGVETGSQFIIGVQFVNQTPDQRHWLASGLRALPDD